MNRAVKFLYKMALSGRKLRPYQTFDGMIEIQIYRLVKRDTTWVVDLKNDKLFLCYNAILCSPQWYPKEWLR